MNPTQTCPRCLQRIGVIATVCVNCGARIIPAQALPQRTPPRVRRPVLLGAVLALLALCVRVQAVSDRSAANAQRRPSHTVSRSGTVALLPATARATLVSRPVSERATARPAPLVTPMLASRLAASEPAAADRAPAPVPAPTRAATPAKSVAASAAASRPRTPNAPARIATRASPSTRPPELPKSPGRAERLEPPRSSAAFDRATAGLGARLERYSDFHGRERRMGRTSDGTSLVTVFGDQREVSHVSLAAPFDRGDNSAALALTRGERLIADVVPTWRDGRRWLEGAMRGLRPGQRHAIDRDGWRVSVSLAGETMLLALDRTRKP